MRLSNYDFEAYKRNDRKSMMSAHNLAFMWYIEYDRARMYVTIYLMYVMYVFLMYIRNILFGIKNLFYRHQSNSAVAPAFL